MPYQYVKELLTRDIATEGELLIEKKIYDTLIDPVVRTRIGRQDAAIPIGPGQIPGSSIDINLASPKTMKVRLIAEGAAVPFGPIEFTSFNMKPQKYGLRIAATKEMIEDGKWDVLAYNIRQAGLEMAYNEDTKIIEDALDNATNTQAGGAAITISDITRAMQYLEDEDYNPKIMYVGPEVANDLRNIDTFVEADKLGTREAFENGLIGTIFGMKVRRFSANSTPTPATYTKYSYIIDPEHAFVIAEKRPVTVENYDDQVHDLSGAVVTQRFKARQLRADAIVLITTS